LTELSPYLLSPLPEGQQFDWSDAFGNHHPTEIEVGFGKGLFLLENAIARKESNFVGIEISRKYQLFTATRIAKRKLANVRLAKADARSFLADHVRAGSVAAIHAYFPDPWWKKRHLKRRLFTPEFVGQCQRVLCPGGSLQIATDVQEYFDMICNLVQSCTTLGPATDGPRPESDDRGKTNFERKFRLQDRPIFRCAFFQKTSIGSDRLSGA
jgi:tRNA (guanine-N7-)-methyltransferase